jgi:hypothetical protein
MIKKSPYVQKKIITGKIVAILDLTIEQRGLKLIAPRSRVIKKNEIHELIVTEEKSAAPGKKVNNVAYVCFFEVSEGGVIVRGDEVHINKKLIGKVIGFDDTHMPNHQNIILYVPKKKTGVELKINLDEEILFKKK